MQALKNLFGNIAVLSLGLLIGFLLLEGIIRFSQLFSEVNVSVPLEALNERGETVYKANLDIMRDAEHAGLPQVRVYTNSEGFVGKDYLRQSDEPRIIALGDSFTAAVGVDTDKNFVSLLEQGMRVPVMNFGVGGQGTVEQLLRYKKVASAWDHKLVVVFFYTNDFENNQYYLPYRDRFGSGGWEDVPLSNANNNLGRKDLKYLLLKNSEAIQLIDSKVRSNAFLETIAIKTGLHHAGVMGVPTEGIHPAFFMYQKPTPENQRQVFEFTGEVLKTFKKTVEENDAHLAVVYLPEAPAVNVKLFEQKKAELPPLGTYEWDFDTPPRALAEALKDAGIPFLDLTPVFRHRFAENPDAVLYANGGGHFTEAGHMLVFEAVTPFVAGLLGKPAN